MALICLLDDDGDEGEWFRVRASETTIGRADADIVIPHDEQISGLHVQLSRRFHENRYQWYLKDLNSMNGTFLKVSKARMQNELEVLIGGHRYRFEFSTPEFHASPDQSSPGTRGWRVVAPPDPKSLMPSFVRLLPEGDGIRLPLSRADHILGSDPQQATPIIADDPMVSPVHAKIWCDPTGKWFLQDENSLNGVWVRISDKRLETDTAFQIGEQRLIVRIS
jgi:pSer/pThr/pTyr-binding forkhead associated (FHA) protein